jgi:hypothetical protein
MCRTIPIFINRVTISSSNQLTLFPFFLVKKKGETVKHQWAATLSSCIVFNEAIIRLEKEKKSWKDAGAVSLFICYPAAAADNKWLLGSACVVVITAQLWGT